MGEEQKARPLVLVEAPHRGGVGKKLYQSVDVCVGRREHCNEEGLGAMQGQTRGRRCAVQAGRMDM